MRVRGNDTKSWIEDGEGTVDKCKGRDNGQEVEPEPQEDVNLFVDNIDWKNAHSIVSLHITGRAISMECTLG